MRAVFMEAVTYSSRNTQLKTFSGLAVKKNQLLALISQVHVPKGKVHRD